jgi:hypothetical protein
MNLRFFIILGLALFAFSCDNTEKHTTSKTKTETTPQSPKVETKLKSNGKTLYPSVPFEIINSLYEKCDYVDYSFEKLPFTISRQEPSDLRHSIAQIAQEIALVDENCPPFGRMIYYKDGSIALEALIYFSKGCNYFVFLENNQPKYANFMTPSGIQFFNGLLAQLQQTPQQ